MNKRAALLPLLGLSLGLTRCALSDHYDLASGAGSSAVGKGGAAGAALINGGATSAGGAGAASQAGDAPVAGRSSAGGTAASAGAAGSQAGSAGAGAVACSSGCSQPETCCGTLCVSLATDAQNCAACGAACDEGRTCSASKCSDGWLSMTPPPPSLGFVARSRAAAVAIGASVFIWGGLDESGNALDSGAVYSPARDSWTAVGKGPGAPSARTLATALWTGSVVIVYGGVDGQGNLLKDASAYDPELNTWSALPPANTRRSQALGFWDGTRAIFWGGTNPSNMPIAGSDRFDLTSWATGNNGGDPGPLLGAAAGFDGSVLYLQGGLINGSTRQDKVFSYATRTDNWSSLAKSLSARGGGFGIWDSSRFLVWGGRDDNGLRNDGKYMYGSSWITMGAIGAPSARMVIGRRSGWTFAVHPGVIAIMGGEISIAQNGSLGTDGATYDVAANTWKAIPSWPSGEQHDYGTGVWTGSEFVLWGGTDNNKPTSTGERITF